MQKHLESLLRLDGPPGAEQPVARYITDALREAGARPSTILRDRAHRGIGVGYGGNLILRLPGRGLGSARAPRRLLSAHMDTVPLCVGSEPKRKGRRWVSGKPGHGIGADNRAGCAVLLNAALFLLRTKTPHPPVTFLWTVQEEVGLAGSRNLDVSKLGEPAMGFNFDGGRPHVLVIGATGAERMTIEVTGVPAHAGVHPQHGVSAIAIASRAIASLSEDGWHGQVIKGDKPSQRGTSNVGAIEAPGATNVVSPRVTLRAEVRAHSKAFRRRILGAYRKAFEAAAKQERNEAGECGRVTLDVSHDYEAFRLPKRSPAVLAAHAAISRRGIEPIDRVVDGGLDANWLTAHGIPTVTLGVGQNNIHTADEWLDIDEFEQACEIAMELAMAGG